MLLNYNYIEHAHSSIENNDVTVLVFESEYDYYYTIVADAHSSFNDR